MAVLQLHLGRLRLSHYDGAAVMALQTGCPSISPNSAVGALDGVFDELDAAESETVLLRMLLKFAPTEADVWKPGQMMLVQSAVSVAVEEQSVLTIRATDAAPFASFVCTEEEAETLELWEQATMLPFIRACARACIVVDRSSGELISGGVVGKVLLPSGPLIYRRSHLKSFIRIFQTSFKCLPVALTADEFYKAAQHPSFNDSSECFPDGLHVRLLPFQQRSLRWMLNRERLLFADDCQDERHPFWSEDMDADQRKVMVNPIELLVETASVHISNLYRSLSYGGILAEEMGLGKTVEVIALILAHCLQDAHVSAYRRVFGDADAHLPQTKATLIVTPSALTSQWHAELSSKARSLRVVYFKSTNGPASDADQFLKADVVLTTYEVLAKEVSRVAQPWKNINFRRPKKFKPELSPLVRVRWFRVCLDEAQNGIASPATSRAEVACAVPRIFSWVISGTPVKKNLNDLYGFLLFLRYRPVAYNKSLWNAVISQPAIFRRLFNSIACRHTKALLAAEVKLPLQHRTILTVEFTPVEQLNYQQICQQANDELDVDETGKPLKNNHLSLENPKTVEAMKKWLVRLRQTCSHPQAGGWSRPKTYQQEQLMSMDEVLKSMIEECRSRTARLQRQYWLLEIERGQIVDLQMEHEAALKVWKNVAEDCGLAIARHKASKHESHADEGNWQISRQSLELRSLRDVEHRAVFFAACAYFQLGDETNEQLYYDKAEHIRRELLAAPLQSCTKLSDELTLMAKNRAHILLIKKIPSRTGGILSSMIADEMDNLTIALNAQSDLLDEFREQIIKFLTLPLVDQDADPNGEEYAQSLDAQEYCSSYLEATKHLVADRIYLVSGLRNSMLDSNTKSQKSHVTPISEQLERLHNRRRNLLPHTNVTILNYKEAVEEIRRRLAKASDELARFSLGPMEIDSLTKKLRQTQDIISTSSKENAALEKEQDLFRAAYNSRIEYYRQLQVLSDNVASYKDLPAKNRKTLQNLEQEIRKTNSKLAKASAQLRYLQELDSWDRSTDFERICVICQGNIELGGFTRCGHIFCQPCLILWLSQSKLCPVCKVQIGGWQAITLKPANLSPVVNQHSYTSKDDIFREIMELRLKSSYGSKIDMITRHLMWLKRERPESCKAVLFSQWRSVLDVVGSSLAENGVTFIRFDKGVNISAKRNVFDAVHLFHTTDIQVFMLYSQSQSAGLSLVNASHVFLVEPLVNSAIEAQAVSRVHRIGQNQETFVWVYIVKATVEERIVKIGTPCHEGDSKNLQCNLSRLISKSGQGEIVSNKDTWDCLFKT